MEKREDALREGLVNNADETERWQQYKRENETAIENLDMFVKHITVDVMVPLGRKAYVPGRLVHTNEALVGHYQGYFSACSVHMAKKICEHRIIVATEHLEKLKTEAELWQNKLEKPYTEGVLPNMDEREIIEDYDEEKERRWREQHKLRVKQAKMREKEERESQQAAAEVDKQNLSDDEILALLEEAELIEDLQKELNNLEVDEISSETIRKLMTGEMQLSEEKPRVAHVIQSNAVEMKHAETETGRMVRKIELPAHVPRIPPTNNNFRPNPELSVGVDEDSNSDSEELPEEVQLIKEQAKLLPVADQVGFYECQIKIIRQKLLTLPISTDTEIEKKIRLMNVLDELGALLEIAEDNCMAESDTEEDEQDVAETTAMETTKPQKRRISFAYEDETLEFRKNECVAEMLQKQDTRSSAHQHSQKRDVIILDQSVGAIKREENSNPAAKAFNKHEERLKKVEQNLEFVKEHQSTKDFDLVNQILESTTGRIHTLHIHFKHSTQSGPEATKNEAMLVESDTERVIESPADIYELYEKKSSAKEPTAIFVNAYADEELVKAPVLREVNRQQAYADPRSNFSNPKLSSGVAEEESVEGTKKSILRNKDAVKKEKRLGVKTASKSKTKKSVPLNEEEYMSAFDKVMKDVVEKHITEPEPLPAGKFIDAHAPKKRISRFKQLRSDMKNES